MARLPLPGLWMGDASPPEGLYDLVPVRVEEMRSLTSEEVKQLRAGPQSVKRWHEGTSLVGYWPEGDSFVFKGFGGHYLCVSRSFIMQIATGKVTFARLDSDEATG